MLKLIIIFILRRMIKTKYIDILLLLLHNSISLHETIHFVNSKYTRNNINRYSAIKLRRG